MPVDGQTERHSSEIFPAMKDAKQQQEQLHSCGAATARSFKELTLLSLVTPLPLPLTSIRVDSSLRKLLELYQHKLKRAESFSANAEEHKIDPSFQCLREGKRSH